MSATVLSSRPSAASGRSWKSLAKALSLKRLGRDFRWRKPRQRPGGARIAGDAGGDGEPLRGKPRATVLDQRRLAAEQMRDAGNVEHQPVAPIERGERGEARAPVAEALEEPRLFRRLGLDRDEAGERARASASDRPTVSPSRAASASTQTSRSALLTLATAASGARLSTPLRRRARSVARRGSQRERNRRIVKSQFLELHCPRFAIPDG